MLNGNRECKNNYTQWYNEPNGGRRENCGMMYKGNGNWNDAGCNSRMASLCEIGTGINNLCPAGMCTLCDVLKLVCV